MLRQITMFRPIATVLVLMILAITMSAFKCGEVKNPPVPLPDKVKLTLTPNGVKVYSPVTVSPQALDVIDRGILTQIQAYNALSTTGREGAVYDVSNLSNFRTLSDYTVLFRSPMATNMDGSPALVVAGQQTAGTTFGVGDGNDTPTIVLPYQNNWAFLTYLETSARFEAEHIREGTNNSNLFSLFTGTGDCHPHAPVSVEENYCGYTVAWK